MNLHFFVPGVPAPGGSKRGFLNRSALEQRIERLERKYTYGYHDVTDLYLDAPETEKPQLEPTEDSPGVIYFTRSIWSDGTEHVDLSHDQYFWEVIKNLDSVIPKVGQTKAFRLEPAEKRA